MRVFVLSLVLFAGVARAQAPVMPARPTAGETAALVGVGAACGTAAAALAASTVNNWVPSDEAGLVIASGALAAGTATCVWGLGRRGGHGGRFTSTLGDAALGVGLGAVAGIGIGYVVYHASGGDRSNGNGFFNDATIAALAAAGATTLVTPALVSALRLPRHTPATIAPVVTTAPDGTRAPGVALRVGL